MTPICPDCQTIHCATDVVALNRFDAHTPTRYMPAGGGVNRATRGEAMADVCAARMTSHAPTTYRQTRAALSEGA